MLLLLVALLLGMVARVEELNKCLVLCLLRDGTLCGTRGCFELVKFEGLIQPTTTIRDETTKSNSTPRQ